jgi:hypothetical protein
MFMSLDISEADPYGSKAWDSDSQPCASYVPPATLSESHSKNSNILAYVYISHL